MADAAIQPTLRMAPALKRVFLAASGVALGVGLFLAFSHFRPPPAHRQAEAVSAPKLPVSGPRIRYPEASAPVLTLPDGQRQAIYSILNIKKQMRFGSFVWNEEGVARGPVWIRIDLARQLLSVFRSGHEIGTAVILFGADSKETPIGVFPVLAKAEHYHSITYDAPMPFMLRLTPDGVAIHASDVKEGSATHGCIGVPREFASRLYSQVKLGDRVAIFARTARPHAQPTAAH